MDLRFKRHSSNHPLVKDLQMNTFTSEKLWLHITKKICIRRHWHPLAASILAKPVHLNHFLFNPFLNSK